MTSMDDKVRLSPSLLPRTVTSMRRSSKKNPRPKIWIRIGIALLVVLISGGVAAGALLHQVSEVKSQLEQALALAHKLRTNLSADNLVEAQQTFDQMQLHISDARSTATGPLWSVATVLPLVGPNFGAVSEVAVSADDIGSRAVGPLLAKYNFLKWREISPKDGKIDVSPLQDLAPTITTAADTVRLSLERIDAIDQAKLLRQVADPVQSATEQLRGISDALNGASAAAHLVPAMLGTEGHRNYLILVQNNAETRATGGIPGALATLSADEGQIRMGHQSSAGALGTFSPPIQVDPVQEALYTARLGSQMQNVNLTPDFPTAALTAKKMWEQRHSEQTVDGVIALDPLVLSHLLQATGPVTLTDPEVLALIEKTSLPKALTNANVIPTLLSDAYREIDDPALQDLYFAAVAGEVFAAFTTGQGDGQQLIRALTTSVQERRLYLWSAREDEQRVIATTALVGSVLGAENGGTSFGVYMNDGTGAKMDYYSRRTAQLLQTCQADGYSTFTVRMVVSNTAPLDAASALPAYVTGGGIFGVSPGHIRTNYVVYGPAQAFVETATVDGAPVPIGAGKHGQRPVGTVALELGPGESAEMDIVFSRVVQSTVPRLHITPGLEPLESVLLATEETGCG